MTLPVFIIVILVMAVVLSLIYLDDDMKYLVISLCIVVMATIILLWIVRLLDIPSIRFN
jgi:hypothetical protein